MPVEAKPLFRPDVLHARLATFELPERIGPLRQKLTHWANLIASGRADAHKETQLLPDFLSDFFYALLGYAGPADGGARYTISREQVVQVDGKFADAVLGNFTAAPSQDSLKKGLQKGVWNPPQGQLTASGKLPSVPDTFFQRQGQLTAASSSHPVPDTFLQPFFQPLVAVEGKGTKDPLDRPFAGRKRSAVEQAYQYAINLPCDWIVITSMRQTRLYYKGTDQYTYERFDTEKLATDEALLRKFVFLLGAERVVPAAGPCHLYALRTASEKVGRELTKEFYVTYANMRQDAFE